MGKDLKTTLLGVLLIFIGGILQEYPAGKFMAILGGIIFGYYFIKGTVAWWKSK